MKKIKMTRKLKKILKKNGTDFYFNLDPELMVLTFIEVNIFFNKLKFVGDENKQIGVGSYKYRNGEVCFNFQGQLTGIRFK